MLFYRYLNLKNYVSRETLIHKKCGKTYLEQFNSQMYLQKSTKIVELVCAIDVFEPGQDWKVAALRASIYVHFFCR